MCHSRGIHNTLIRSSFAKQTARHSEGFLRTVPWTHFLPALAGSTMNTNLYDLPTNGNSSGVGTFAEGTITKVDQGYHLDGATITGRAYRCYIEHVFVDYRQEPPLDTGDTLDVEGMEFRLGNGELDLREAPEPKERRKGFLEA